MPFDLHTHFLPDALADVLRTRSEPPFIRRDQGIDGERLTMPIGSLAFTSAYTDMTARVDFMEEHGIGCCVHIASK